MLVATYSTDDFTTQSRSEGPSFPPQFENYRSTGDTRQRWQMLWLSQAGRVVLLASSGWGPRGVASFRGRAEVPSCVFGVKPLWNEDQLLVYTSIFVFGRVPSRFGLAVTWATHPRK